VLQSAIKLAAVLGPTSRTQMIWCNSRVKIPRQLGLPHLKPASMSTSCATVARTRVGILRGTRLEGFRFELEIMELLTN
jgi:hypothetical protein